MSYCKFNGYEVAKANILTPYKCLKFIFQGPPGV